MPSNEIERRKTSVWWMMIAASGVAAAAAITAFKASRRARKTEERLDREIRRLLTNRPPAWAGRGTTGSGQRIP
jgi:hypothetical protein